MKSKAETSRDFQALFGVYEALFLFSSDKNFKIFTFSLYYTF